MKYIFYGLLTCLLFSTQVNAKNAAVPGSNPTTEESVLKVKEVTGSITLSGGCKITYTLVIDYDVIPPRINSIHGTLTMSGPCSGTQTFFVTATLDNDNRFTDIKTDLPAEYQKPRLYNAMLESLNAANLFSE